MIPIPNPYTTMSLKMSVTNTHSSKNKPSCCNRQSKSQMRKMWNVFPANLNFIVCLSVGKLKQNCLSINSNIRIAVHHSNSTFVSHHISEICITNIIKQLSIAWMPDVTNVTLHCSSSIAALMFADSESSLHRTVCVSSSVFKSFKFLLFTYFCPAPLLDRWAKSNNAKVVIHPRNIDCVMIQWNSLCVCSWTQTGS